MSRTPLLVSLECSTRPPAASLAVSGFLALFLELAFIRWAPAQASALGYFTNFVLLAAFFGLGLGTLLVKRWWLATTFPVLVFLTVNVFLAYSWFDMGVTFSPGFYLWEMSFGQARVNLGVFLAASFVLLALPFVPIGVVMAQAFKKAVAVRGYAWNIAGSLAGIVVFAGLSALNTEPWVWFAAAALAALWLFPMRPIGWSLASGVVLTLVVFQVYVGELPFNWSPYYRIELQPLAGQPSPGYELRVNTDYHQLILDLSDERVSLSPELSGWRSLYDLPYSYSSGPDVLVVGAGTGNDVAGALRAGAGHVDAVEIDPLILRMGERLHPEHPYQSDRVELHCQDARAYFRTTDRRYDLVVFGFLDSHTLLSSLSSVRLDSYVYTLESLREMRRLLKPDGVMALTFSVEREWIGQRLYGMVAEVFGAPPVVRKIPSAPGTVFLAGPGLDPGAVSDPSPFADATVKPATDAWPFLYFERPGIPDEYALAIVIVAVLGVLGVSAASVRTATRPQPFFFFLGAGFMLLETRSVTVTALLFGSTWQTNAVVFGSILLLILGATLWTVRRPAATGVKWPFGLVFGSLLLVYAFPLERFVAAPVFLKLLVSVVPMLPILFAGILFARAFATAQDPDVAFGSNLLGALAGGLSEYASLVVGFPNLVWIALGMYALASATPRRHSARTADPAAARDQG